ncbi:MAG: RNA polymerase sigma factor [Mucinivorans sp.]
MTNNDKKEQFLNALELNTGIIIKITGAYAQTQEDRKDLMQDIILELWKSFKRFDGSCKISTWIYRISLNVSMNYKRKRKNTLVILSTNEFDEKDVTSILLMQEYLPELETLYSCIEELSQINKAIILLYLDGYSHKEIFEITGVSVTNVGTRIGRIKEELRTKIRKNN